MRFVSGSFLLVVLLIGIAAGQVSLLFGSPS
jgi:hypothetical protein